MKTKRKNFPARLPLFLLIFLSLVCFVLLWNILITTSFGSEDFRAYWSATYLLHKGLNPYDPGLIQAVETAQTHIISEDTLMAWNPPFLFVFLLPLAWLSFPVAKSIWLIVNLILVLAGILMVARVYLPAGNKRIAAIFLFFALSLPQLWAGILIGQVTFLVFTGLIASIVLIRKERWFWAGAVLILTLIKPHIVVLPLIYLLVYMAQRRQFKGWIGLISVGIICLVVVFIFRPQWVSDLIGEMAISPVHWQTPTIGGFLSYLGLTDVVRYMIILLLPLPFILIRYQATIKMEMAVALLTLITVPTTFFGWSFDQVILLIPIAQVFSWMARSKKKTFNTAMGIVIGISLLVLYIQRFQNSNDVYYFWISLFWWVIFGLNWYLFSATPPLDPKTEKIS